MAQQERMTAQVVATHGLESGPAVSPDGFSDFYRSSYRVVLAAVMYAGADIEEARDSASKAYLEMLQIWPVEGNPLAYARKAAVHNFIKDKNRRARLIKRLFEGGYALREEAEDACLTAYEDRERVSQILSRLSPALREVMEGIADGLGRGEIARKHGISSDALRRRLADARARLIEILSPDGEFRQPSSPAAGTFREEETR